MLRKGFFNKRNSTDLNKFDLLMKDLIQTHKKLIKTVKDQMGFSDYGMYWLAFLEGGLTIWLLDRIFFHWLKF